MDAPGVLLTQRLRLRRPTPADAPAAFAYGSDPEVTRYMDWRRLESPEEAAAFLERCEAGWRDGSEFTWMITLRQAGDLAIGAIGCRARETEADYGFVLNRHHWGQGLMTEAATSAVGWLFSIQWLQRVWATCDVENTRSARVLEKSGLRREGLVPGGMVRPNVSDALRDSYLYARNRGSLTPIFSPEGRAG
jgi:RimJ/RimL family protein N-acetyltransferase